MLATKLPTAGHDVHFPYTENATLEEHEIDRLFADVGQRTKLLDVVLRDGLWATVDGGPPTEDPWDRLDFARDVLDDGAFVQLRYLHEGTEWWDTLVPLMDGRVRLLRVHRGGLAAAHWS
jgi:hypothetical protein